MEIFPPSHLTWRSRSLVSCALSCAAREIVGGCKKNNNQQSTNKNRRTHQHNIMNASSLFGGDGNDTSTAAPASYFAVTNDRCRFVHDVRLRFDADEWTQRRYRDALCACHMQTVPARVRHVGDPRTKKWHRETIDLNTSGVPPSLFLAVVQNCYSSTFGLHVPLDMDMATFSRRAAHHVAAWHGGGSGWGSTNAVATQPGGGGSSACTFPLLENMLRETEVLARGGLVDARTWNRTAARHEYLWVVADDDDGEDEEGRDGDGDAARFSARHSLQALVFLAQSLWNLRSHDDGGVDTTFI